MSNRTLVEINHDYWHKLRDEGFVPELVRYLHGPSDEGRDNLESFGFRPIAQRHHTQCFSVLGIPDGFPMKHFLSSAAAPNAPALISLKEAFGRLVSTCADAKDVFPDDTATLAALTEMINEVYACLEDVGTAEVGQ